MQLWLEVVSTVTRSGLYSDYVVTACVTRSGFYCVNMSVIHYVNRSDAWLGVAYMWSCVASAVWLEQACKTAGWIHTITLLTSYSGKIWEAINQLTLALGYLVAT